VKLDRNSIVTRYGVAVASVAAATALRLALDPVMGNEFPFAFFFFAILFAAWFGGGGPALFAVVLGAWAADYFLLGRRGAFGPAGMGEVVGMTLYAATGSGIALLGGMMKGARAIAAAQSELAASRESARQTEARLGEIVNSATDAIVVVDAQERIVLYNAAAEQMFGCPRSGAIGQNLDRFIPPPGRAALWSEIRTGGATRSPRPVYGRRADGREFPLEASVSQSERGEAGGQKVFTLILRDLSERRHAEEEAALLAAIVQSSLDAIVGKDLDGVVRTWNPAAAAMFGYAADEIVGRPISLLIPDDHRDEEDLILSRVKRGLSVEHIETLRRRKDGSLVDVSVTVSPIIDSGGRVVGASKVARDISERKRAEAVLREREEQFRLFIEHSPAAIAMFDRDMRYLVASRRWIDDYGLAGKPIIGCSHYEIFPEMPERWKEIHRRCLGGRVEKCEEDPFLRADGKTQWIRWEVRPWNQGDGSIGGIIIFAEEITARKQAEQARLASDARYRTLFEQAPDGILIANAGGGYIDANPSVCGLLGYTREELTRLHSNDLVGPAERASVPATLAELNAGAGHHREWQFRRKDGSVVVAEVMGTMMPDGNLMGVVRDITERRRAEAALQEKERQLHAADRRLAEIMQGMTEACFALDQEWRFTFVNDRGVTLFRHSRPELLGRPIWEVFRKLVGTPMEAHYRRAMSKRIPVTFEAFSPIVERWVEIRLFPTADGLAAFLLDISDRKQSEEAIWRLNAELEQRVDERTAELADLYNNAPCGYHSLNAEGEIVRINDTELRWLGYEREEIVGRKKVLDVLTPASGVVFAEAFPVFKARGSLEDLELEMVRKDGSVLPVLLNATVVRDQEGNFLMSRSTMVDYTDRKRAETALRAWQARLEAANRELEAFSYSVSHDLRTPLRAIDGFSQAVLEDCGPLLPEEGRRFLATIRTSAQRMGELIDDLLAFSKLGRQALRTQVVDTGKLVQSSVADLQGELAGRQVAVKIGPLPPCEGDPALLKQVWLNLLSNAIKYTRRCAAAVVEVGCREEGGAQVFFVRDNGSGFDMQYAHKLFGVFQRLHRLEDFEGTGVGLAIVQRIVARHGGRIWAHGVVDQGATFSFTLNEGAKQ